jgi:hypothetical protein
VTVTASITPTQANSFAIAQVWSDGGGAAALGGSWTTAENTHFSTLYQSNLAGWQSLASASAVSLSASGGSGNWIAMVANFYAGGTVSQVAAPTFSPAEGVYSTSQSVLLSSATAGASIRYTTDGSTPTSTTGILGSSVVVAAPGATIRAIAYKAGMTDSTVASSTYTIGTPQWTYSGTTASYSGNKVGIGTANPQYLLSVSGVIGAKEVIVTNTGWSDYVFLAGYRLRPLPEVEAYIGQHHHLPEIPSEAEVKENGVSMGEMQSKLLAKIEELTLHLIEQEKENARLRERVERLEQKPVALAAPAVEGAEGKEN